MYSEQMLQELVKISEVPFQEGTSEVTSSKASVNGLFTSEIKIIFGQILY